MDILTSTILIDMYKNQNLTTLTAISDFF